MTDLEVRLVKRSSCRNLATWLRPKRPALLASLLAVFTANVALTSYVYMPFRPERGEGDDNRTMTLRCSEGHSYYVLEKETSTLRFKVVLYLGLGIGSLLGGYLPYRYSPEWALLILTKMAVTFGLLGVTFVSLHNVAFDIVWFLLAVSVFSIYLPTLIYSLETVPGTWLVHVGIGLFGILWSLCQFYSIWIPALLHTWQDRIAVTTLVAASGIFLNDLLNWRSLGGKVEALARPGPPESMQELIRNPLGLRYLACLSALWTVHGFSNYSSLSNIYANEHRNHYYASLTITISILLAWRLCCWTKQKRAVMSAFMVLNGISSLVLCTIGYLELWSFNAWDDEVWIETVALTDQVCHFLAEASWCILWMMTPEIFGNKLRYLVTGLCCCMARLSSLLGMLVVHYCFYPFWPIAVVGTLWFACSVIVFLLPEPNFTKLTASTRRGSGAYLYTECQC